MRFLALLTGPALLAACATAAAPAPITQVDVSAPAPAAPPYSRLARLLAAAGSADAPTQSEVERALGPADISRRDGAGAALTYRLENCALLLLFAADARNDMRLAEANPSARRAGGEAPSLEQRAAEASGRGS
ncbi:MAG: hypothetical protein ACREH4_11990 [Vitreimonas sp.]